MAWLYVPGSEDSSLGSAPSWAADIAVWVTSSGMPTQRPLSWRGWTARPWIVRLFGTICRPTTAAGCEEAWTSFLLDSRANLSARLAEVGGPLSICGPTCAGSCASAQHRSSSARTSSASPSSEPAGTLLEPVFVPGSPVLTPPSWVPRIGASDGGYLPTLTTRQNQFADSMQKWPAYARLRLLCGRRVPIAFWEWMMGLPIGWTASGSSETR
jgi:hypothetical protein